VNFVYYGNLCIFIYILLKHISRHNLTNCCHPQVKLIGKGLGRSFTCIPLCLNSGPFSRSKGLQNGLYQLTINPGKCYNGAVFDTSIWTLEVLKGFQLFRHMWHDYPRWNVLWGETFFFGQQNPFLLKYTQNWSLSAHTGVVPVTHVQY
jgi:hypothetical protein